MTSAGERPSCRLAGCPPPRPGATDIVLPSVSPQKARPLTEEGPGRPCPPPPALRLPLSPSFQPQANFVNFHIEKNYKFMYLKIITFGPKYFSSTK